MTDKHFSSLYENELRVVSARLMELGRQVDCQICQSIDALSHFDSRGAQQVVAAEAEVNALEIEIDHEIIGIIARRQPAARDLRLLMAMSKASSNLERLGNEAHRMANVVLTLIGAGVPRILLLQELSVVTKLTTGLLGKAMQAFTQLDLAEALAVLKEDKLRFGEVDSLVHKLVNRSIETPHMTSICVELISLTTSLEQVVEHAKHIAEQVIYVVQGVDVRHTTVEQIESQIM
jgi:phosphate transport system protein